MLGPLVSPLLRAQDGSLDPSKFPTESIEAFRQFLITQVKIDGVAFNEHLLDSYHKVLGKEKYRGFMEELLEEARGKNSGETNGALLKEFTADLIDVSAQNFVSAHIDHEGGRNRLRSALFDHDHYKPEIRSDLAKAIAQVGYQRGASARTFQRFNRKAPVMDYWNLSVSTRDIDAASFIADEILQAVGQHEMSADALQKKYLENPSAVQRFAGLERELGGRISDAQIQEQAKYAAGHSADLNPIAKLKSHLAHFWLLVVDEGHWKEGNGYKSGKNGAYLLRRTEALLKQGEGIGNEAEFIKWSEAVRGFIQGGLDGDGFFASGTVSEMMAAVPQAHRSAYDELKRFVDEIHFANEMGEKIYLPVVRGISPGHRPEAVSGGTTADSLAEVQEQFLHGLHQAKRSLWHGYKQHKGLSRGISQVASWFDSGDIVEIKSGQHSLDQLIEKVRGAKDADQIQAVIADLQDQLKENGQLHLAMRAAEMEGTEQLIGLGQTVLILLASRGLIGVAGRVRALASGARAAGAAGEATSLSGSGVAVSVSSPLAMAAREGATRMGKAYALGNYLSVAENAAALASGELRPDGEHWKTWLKDSTATGLSMMVFAPFPLLGDKFNTGVLWRDMARRYGAGATGLSGKLAVGARRLAADTTAEIPQEWLDAFARARMDDGHAVIGFDQAREIAMVSALGGAKMGLVKEMLKGAGEARTSGPHSEAMEDLAAGPEQTRSPRSLRPLQQIQNLAEAYGTQNPLIRHAPFLFPLTHPGRVRSHLEISLKETLLGPLARASGDHSVPALESLWRNSAYRSAMLGIKLLYPAYWLATRPFGLLKGPERRVQNKILEEWEQRRDAFAARTNPSETDYEALLARPDLSFHAVVDWARYQTIAAATGWDPQLVLARGLRDAAAEEVEVLLEQAFGKDLDAKVAFLSQYPLRGGVEILRREIAQFIPGRVPAEGFPLYFNIADILERMGRMSRTALDMRSQPGIHPQTLVQQAYSVDLDDEIRLRSLETTLKYLQDRMAPEEVWVPGLDWFENPRLKAAVIRLWGKMGRKDFLPEILAVLKNEKDPKVLQAAAFTLGQWRASEAVAPLSELAQHATSALARIAARRALGRIQGSTDVEQELLEWLDDGRLADFDSDHEIIWLEMGGRSVAPWLELPVRPAQTGLIVKNKSHTQGLELAQALLAVEQDYRDRNLHPRKWTEYQIVADRILLDVLLDGSGRNRSAALETMLQVPERSLKRLLHSREARDWFEPEQGKFNDLHDFMLGYLREDKNPLESRVAVLGLLWEKLPDAQLRGLLDPLLADPGTAPVVSQALDQVYPNWDSYIQETRHRLMTPSEASSGEGGKLFDVTPVLGAMAMMGVESPWAYALGALVSVGMAWSASGKRRGKRAQLRETILSNSKIFYRPLDKAGEKRFEETLGELAEDPAFQDNYLLNQIATASELSGQGMDPIMVLHNTGASTFQLKGLMTGVGEGSFPMTIRSQMDFHPDTYRISLDRFSLRRHAPYLTLDLTVSASQLLEWMKTQREFFAAQGPGTNETIPAALIPSLIRWAQERGSAKLLGLPQRSPEPYDTEESIRDFLSRAGFENLFIKAQGPYFEDVLDGDDREKSLATVEWAKPLAEGIEVQLHEYSQAWIELVWDHWKKQDPIALVERPLVTELETVAKQENLVLPNPLVMAPIYQELANRLSARAERAGKKMRAKQPVTGFPEHNLMKVMEVWKRGHGIPEAMVYHSFGKILGVSLESWLARVVKRGRDPDLGIDEAMLYLFRQSDDALRPFQELQWINQYRLPQGLRVVEKYLNHTDQKVRTLAIQTLIDMHPLVAPPALLEMVHDFIGSPGVSNGDWLEISLLLKALRVLGIPPGPRASLLRPYLLALMDSRIEEKRTGISDRTGKFTFAHSDDSFEGLYRQGTRRILSYEAEATYHRLGFGGGKPFLETELAHYQKSRRMLALQVIFEAKLPNFEPAITAMLDDPGPEVRGWAIKVLAQRGGEGAGKMISERLLSETDLNARIVAAEALLRLQDPASAPAVQLKLQREVQDFPGQIPLIELLGQLKDRSAIPLLERVLHSASTEVRLTAATALARMGQIESAGDVFAQYLLNGGRASRALALQKLWSLPTSEGFKLFRAVRNLEPEKFKRLLGEDTPDAFRLWDRYQRGWDKRVQANWDWLRTELKNGALISPRIKDPTWRRFLKDSLRNKEGDLGAGFSLRYQQVLEEAARNELSRDETRIQLMQVLQDDFQDALYEHGGRIASHDLREVIENNVDQSPQWIRTWLADRSAGRISFPTLTLSREELAKIDHPTQGNEGLSNSLELYETLAEQITPILGLPSDFLIKREDEAVHLSFLPIHLLLESLQARFGDAAVQPHDTSDVSTLWDTVRIVRKHGRPLLISKKNGDIEGRRKVAPFVMALHDVYHLLTMSQLPEEVQSGALVLIEIMEETGMIQEDSPELGALLDGLLSASDPGFGEIFDELSYSQLEDPILVEIFYEKLKEKTEGRPNQRLILAKFETIFADKLGIAEWATQPPPPKEEN